MSTIGNGSRARVCRDSWQALWAVGICALAIGAGLSVHGAGDYAVHGAVSGDNAGPALAALAHGDLARFAQRQPLMGLTSLLLRLPLAAAGSALGAGQLTSYRLGALACLAPCAVMLAWLVSRRPPSAVELAGGALATYVLLLSGPAAGALRSGHPEELLAAALSVAAVLAARSRRGRLAGLLLGAAIGTKAWAAVALIPVLAKLPERRGRAVISAGAVAAALILPPVLADPAAFARAGASLGSSHLTTALSGWWPLGITPHATVPIARLARTLPLALTKSTALAAALAAGAALSLLLWVRSPRGSKPDPLVLLALLGLVRCIGDPAPVEYYYLAVLVPLAFWEWVSRRRLPVVTVLALLLLSVEFGAATELAAWKLNLVAVGGAGVLATWLILRAAPRVRARPEPAAPTRAQIPAGRYR